MDPLIDIFTKQIFAALAAELNKQNHRLTGALVDSFEAKVKETTKSTIIEFLMFNYGVYLNDGIPANKIPYTPPPPRRGGKSKYIQGLIRWAKIKFRYNLKQATSMAFAVAKKHKEKGYPLTQKGFINITLAANETQIINFIEDWVEQLLEDFLKEFLIQN